MSGEEAPAPNQTPEADLREPEKTQTGFYRFGVLSVLKWGGIPQGIGLLFALLVHPFLKPAPTLAGVLFFSTVPIYLFALACGIGRVVSLHRSNPSNDIGKGATLGGVLFVGIWILTSGLGCGVVWMDVKF